MKSRLVVLVAAFALIGAACATESVPTASPAGTGETTTPSTAAPNPDAVAAPDFTLALGTGGSFTLSEEARPVFLVFWAEW